MDLRHRRRRRDGGAALRLSSSFPSFQVIMLRLLEWLLKSISIDELLRHHAVTYKLNKLCISWPKSKSVAHVIAVHGTKLVESETNLRLKIPNDQVPGTLCGSDCCSVVLHTPWNWEVAGSISFLFISSQKYVPTRCLMEVHHFWFFAIRDECFAAQLEAKLVFKRS